MSLQSGERKMTCHRSEMAIPLLAMAAYCHSQARAGRPRAAGRSGAKRGNKIWVRGLDSGGGGGG